jgi:hypothetical protein
MPDLIAANYAEIGLASAANNLHNLRMNRGDSLYIWDSTDWPAWRYDLSALAPALAQTSRAQGMLFGRLADWPT